MMERKIELIRKSNPTLKDLYEDIVGRIPDRSPTKRDKSRNDDNKSAVGKRNKWYLFTGKPEECFFKT